MISILLIEDDKGICELITERLISCNYFTICKHRGEDALEWLISNSPSLIILDYGLPDMTGKEFISRLSKITLPPPPFIVATGQGDESIAVEMMKMGAMDYITKDTAFLDILPEIVKHIEKELDNKKKLKDAQEQLYQSRKMEAIGILAGGIAHDFNNMLTGILGATYVLQRKLPADKETEEFINIIIQSAERAADLTAKLLTFGRKGKTASMPVDIHQIIQDTFSLLKRSINKKITLQNSLSAIKHTITGDLSQLQNALLNLGINASHAMPEGGSLSFATANTFLDDIFCKTSRFALTPGSYIEIKITDNGTGITPENITKIFDPYFTTKKSGEGTGLGLSATYGTIQDHRGAIFVDSQEGYGTTFTILLPLTAEDPPRQQKNEPMITGSGTILFTDDEKSIRTTVKAMLENMGYSVLIAEDGQTAVDIYRKNQDKISAVILDMNMPVMNGKEAFYKIRKINNESTVIISTGHTKSQDITEMTEHGLSGYISKPYQAADLNRLLIKTLH